MNPKSNLYRSLQWMYQPLKAIKYFYQQLKYLPIKKAKLLKYKQAQAFSGLHIGCGRFYLPDWLNTDLLKISNNPKIDFPLDISNQLSLPDNFFDVIYGSEVIEHIELAEARSFFRDSHRILKPGGIMRLTTPNITEICRIFLGLRNDINVEDFKTVWLEEKYTDYKYPGEFSKEIWINSMFQAWGHKHLWTFESLLDELGKAGFVEIEVRNPQQTKSNKPQLNNLETRYSNSSAPIFFASTLIVEACKPSR